MFREVRRKTNEINEGEIKELLIKSRRGVLSTHGDDEYPYAIPVNYLYNEDRNSIYFHTSKIGHKIDALNKNNKVCFTIIGDEATRDLDWAPYVKSVVIFGRCKFIQDNKDAMRALKDFAMKFYPSEEMVDDQIAKTGSGVQMFEIEIDHIIGKEVQEN